MKKLILLTLLPLIFTLFISAQQVTVSFQPKADTVSIDSVHVTNLTRGQTVKLLPGESVVFNLVTSAEHPSLDGSEDGYLYPNPLNEYATLVFNTIQSEKVFIAINDMQGKLLFRKTLNLMQGSHRFQLSFPAPGLYHIAVLKKEKPLSYKALYTGRNQQEAGIRYLGSEALADEESQKDQLKNAQNGKSLDYSEGDVVHYTVYSGENTTVISDVPSASKTIEVEFYECIEPDNRSYKIVQIGGQWWMAENLAYLPSVSPSSQGSFITPYYYVYDYQGTDVAAAKATDNYKTYGVLYNWPAAMAGASSSNSNPSGIKGICPDGWHLPSDAEWQQLEDYLIANGYNYDVTTSLDKVAKSLAAKIHWKTSSNTGAIGNDLSSNNSSGFSALPGGYRSYNESFNHIGIYGIWWSSNEYDSDKAWYRNLYYGNSNFIQDDGNKISAISVRCVRDNPEKLPALNTIAPSEVASTTAKSGGEITSDGGSPISVRGLVWSKNQQPTLEQNEGNTTDTSEGNTFINLMEGLSPNTTYFVRAYATNRLGTAYGNPYDFTTKSVFGQLTDTRGGETKTYKTVKIGNQEWMAENLAYLPAVHPLSYGDYTKPLYYVYGYVGTDAEAAKQQPNYKTYGVLYNWPAAMAGASSSSNNPSGVQGICPTGWHLPSDAEWEQLAQYISDQKGPYSKSDDNWLKVGKHLKATSGWNYNGNGDDDFGFSALPGGYCSYYNFGYIGNYGYWWSSTESSSSSAWYLYLDSGNSYFYRSNYVTSYGYSVRCVRD